MTFPSLYYEQFQHLSRCHACGNFTRQVVKIRTNSKAEQDEVFRLCQSCRDTVRDRKGNHAYETQRIYDLIDGPDGHHATIDPKPK